MLNFRAARNNKRKLEYFIVSRIAGGERLGKQNSNDFNHPVQAVYESLNFFAAILILTGQITNGGVFVTPESFSLSLSGPFTGRTRKKAIPGVPQANLIIDAIDIIAALLLILGQIHVHGVYITSGGYSIVLGGPPFGLKDKEAYNPIASRFFADYRKEVFEKHQIHRMRV